MSALKHARIPVYENPHYKKSGIKSYVWLLQKYGFKPTKEGPYFREAATHHTVHHQGKFGVGGLHDLQKKHHTHQGKRDESSSNDPPAQSAVGGRTTILSSVLQKKIDANGTVGQVTSQDQQNDSLYLSPVSIGTPAQTFNLDFDTGSSDLWVWSTSLDSATQQQGVSGKKNIFDPSKSSTWKAMDGSTWQIGYGDGSSASGTVGTDVCQIGGLTIQNQAIEIASTLSSAFAQGNQGDGLLGLAMGSINTVKPNPVKTPVENMISEGDIDKTDQLFTANLGTWRDSNEADKGVSFYTFGYVDQAVLQASGVTAPYYTPLITPNQGFWMFDSASYSINGTVTQRSGNTAIADTGTTLALVDDATCEAIYAAIPGSKYDSTNQGWVFPTSSLTDASLPAVGVAVGDQIFYIQKEDLPFAETDPGWVYGGIQSRGSMTFDILGDTFLKSVYAVFDLGNQRFGACQRKEQEQNLAPPQSTS